MIRDLSHQVSIGGQRDRGMRPARLALRVLLTVTIFSVAPVSVHAVAPARSHSVCGSLGAIHASARAPRESMAAQDSHGSMSCIHAASSPATSAHYTVTDVSFAVEPDPTNTAGGTSEFSPCAKVG
jgi:hypothetical protein